MQIHSHGDPTKGLEQDDIEYPYHIYLREMYINGQSLMCSIHDAFPKANGTTHNCIGCNLREYTDLLLNASKRNYQRADLLQSFAAAIIYSYLLIERMETIFKIIELPEAYRLRHFQVLIQIRRWANFLKHPKAFMFAHHPTYHFSNDVTLSKTDYNRFIVIDQVFIDSFYKGDGNNQELRKRLTNKKDVIVVLRELTELIDKFSHA